MSLIRLRSALVVLAGILMLAAAAQAAQTTPAASSDDTRKGVKRVHTTPSKPTPDRQAQGRDADKGETAQPDMIMLQEPFRGGAATPVSITHGR